MAITFVNASSDVSASGTTHTGTAPSGIQDNDILVGALLYDSSTDSATWPAGWAEWAKNSNEASPLSWARVGWKRASGESGGYQWTGLPDCYHYSVIAAFRGCKASGDPANVAPSNTAYRTSDTIVRAAGVTTTQPQCALIWVGSVNGNATITKPADFTTADYETDAGYYDLHMAYKLGVAQGATGNTDGSISATLTSKHAFLIPLQMAAPTIVASQVGNDIQVSWS